LAITPLTWLALRAIALYQRHLSPRKGYCCALHATGGGRSCSAYGYRAIARAGVFKGCRLLRRRFDACARSARIARPATQPLQMRTGKLHQRGFCDVGDCSGCADGHDALECAGEASDCDWPWERRKGAKPESNLDDYLNNENALRERIRQAQERARRDS
jgi:putative component of membrane protein insertase Oxa1/YidC/SpoIIIJ protein YidD